MTTILTRIRQSLAIAICGILLVVPTGCGTEQPTDTPQKPGSSEAPGDGGAVAETPVTEPAEPPTTEPPVEPDSAEPVGDPGEPAAGVGESAVIVVKPDDEEFDEKLAATTPLSPSPQEVQAGDRTIKAELCSVVGRQFFDKGSMSVLRAVEVIGDRLMVIDTNRHIHCFTIGDDGLTLTIDPSFGDDGTLTEAEDVEALARGDGGRLLASGFGGTYVIKDGEVESHNRSGGHVTMHPSGTWGIATRGNRISRVELADGECKVEEFTLTSPHHADPKKSMFGLIFTAAVLQDGIVIGGSVPLPEGERKTANQVVVFDTEGNERFRFGNLTDAFAEDGFGWAHGIEPCSTGLCVVDSNLRRLTLWSDDGKLLSKTAVGDLLGVIYPWLPDFTITPDGTAYFIAGQDREGGEVAEGLIYRVTGL